MSYPIESNENILVTLTEGGLVETAQIVMQANDIKNNSEQQESRGEFKWGIFDKRNQVVINSGKNYANSVIAMNTIETGDCSRIVTCSQNGEVYLLPYYACNQITENKFTHDHKMKPITQFSYPHIGLEHRFNFLNPIVTYFASGMVRIKRLQNQTSDDNFKENNLSPIFVYCLDSPGFINIFTSDILKPSDNHFVEACIENGLVHSIINYFQQNKLHEKRELFSLPSDTVQIIQDKSINDVINGLLNNDVQLRPLKQMILSLR